MRHVTLRGFTYVRAAIIQTNVAPPNSTHDHSFAPIRLGVPDHVTIEYTKAEEEEDGEDARSLRECLKAGRLKNITQRVLTGTPGMCFTSQLVSIRRGEHIEWELLAQDGAPLQLIGPCNTNARTEVRLSDLFDSDTGVLIGTAVTLGYNYYRARGRHCSLSPDASEQFKRSLAYSGINWNSGMRKRGYKHIPAPDDCARLQA